jgi:hypothetical protein
LEIDALTTTWLLLHYKLPSTPTASRVYIWRKLKRLGALLWQDAVWILPHTARTQEQFQWLAAEIIELAGEVSLWEARSLWAGQEATLIEQFSQQVAAMYQEILTELGTSEPDLKALARRYQQTRMVDYFDSALSQRVRQALLSVRGAQPE